jgi:hypothetical protein
MIGSLGPLAGPKQAHRNKEEHQQIQEEGLSKLLHKVFEDSLSMHLWGLMGKQTK